MELVTATWLWLRSHPLEVAAIALYLLANVAPRPHPEGLAGWRRLLWATVDRLCILTAARVPGAVKGLFEASPRKEPKP